MAEGLWILDASVAVGWFFEDDPSRKVALAVRAELAGRPERFVVPPLFHSELIHVLSRKSAKDREFVEAGLALILRLGIRTVTLSEEALLRTVAWTCRGLSGYDATYLALAEDLRGRWLTADQRAARTAGSVNACTLTAWSRRRRVTRRS